MSSWPRRPWARWAVPVLAAGAIVGAALVGPTVAAADPDLPALDARELLAGLRTEPVPGFSGTVVHRADLGLPALPGASSGDPTGVDPLALLDGEHTLRVWASGEDRRRVSLHGTIGEVTVARDGSDVWAFASEDRTATRVTVPGHEHAGWAGGTDAAALAALTPEALAQRVLDAADASTDVRVAGTTTVAGRPAYELLLTPRTAGTLVADVRIAVDAAERVATRVQVRAVGHEDPALEVGFTRLSFVPPEDEVFRFDPPPGTVVEELEAYDRTAPPVGGPTARPDVTVVGDDWTTVLVAGLPPLPVGSGGPAREAGDEAGELLGRDGPRERPGTAERLSALVQGLPTVEGTWGTGRLLTSRLLTVLLTDDGRVLVGAVPPTALEDAAAATAP